MVTLSPRFTFLATLCVLAALSSAPISDAAVLGLRASDPALANIASGDSHAGAAPWFSRHSSHVVDEPPVLPLPQSPGVSHKNYAASGDTPSSSSSKDDQNIPSAGGSHGEKDVSAGVESKGSPYDDNGAAPGEGGKFKDRRWNPFRPIGRLNELWFGDNHVHHSRVPHHHHHHHHGRYPRRLWTAHPEPGHDRDLSGHGTSTEGEHVVHPLARHHHQKPHEKVVVSGDHDHVRVGRSPHHHSHNGHEKVIVTGNNDHVRVGRSPHHHHHHHHHHDEHEKVIVTGNHDHVRVGRSPHHHHHHNEHEKVIVTGDRDHVRVGRSPDGHRDEKVTISRDDDHVHIQRSVFIAGELGHSYVVPRVAKRSATQEQFTLGKRANGLDGAPGRIDIMSPSDDDSGGERIASLVLAPSNSTTSENSTTPSPPFVLNASGLDGTQMYLLASSSNSSKSVLTPDEIGVTLRVAMFDVASASIAPYCATYDPDPPAPAPLAAERCTEDPVGKRQSQLFAFDRTTGVVRPMWFNAQDSESHECIDDVHAAPQNATLPSVTEVESSHSDSTSSADRVSTSNFGVLTADSSHMVPSDESEGGVQGAQNVALVFVATNPEVLDTPADPSATASSVLATTTTAIGSSTPGILATGPPAAQVTSSSLSSVSTSTISSSGSNASVVSSGTPSSATPVSGTVATSSMVLGVQVVPESASAVGSTTSSSTTPTMTPVNTQPYAWMFYPDS